MENTLQELGTFVTIVAILMGVIGLMVVGAIATAITLLVKKIKSPDTNTKGTRPYRSGNKSSQQVRSYPRQAYRAKQRKIRRRTFKHHQQTRRTRTTA